MKLCIPCGKHSGRISNGSYESCTGVTAISTTYVSNIHTHVVICLFQVKLWHVGCWNYCKTTLWTIHIAERLLVDGFDRTSGRGLWTPKPPDPGFPSGIIREYRNDTIQRRLAWPLRKDDAHKTPQTQEPRFPNPEANDNTHNIFHLI